MSGRDYRVEPGNDRFGGVLPAGEMVAVTPERDAWMGGEWQGGGDNERDCGHSLRMKARQGLEGRRRRWRRRGLLGMSLLVGRGIMVLGRCGHFGMAGGNGGGSRNPGKPLGKWLVFAWTTDGGA